MENGYALFPLRKANRLLQLLVVHLLIGQAFLAGQQGEDRFSRLDVTMQQMAALFASGKDAQGIALGEPALREARAMLQMNDPKLVMLEMGMALAYQRLGRVQDAESLYLAVAGTNAPEGFLCDANLMLGYIADFGGRKYESNQRLRTALSLAATFLSEDKARILRIRNSLAQSDLGLANIPEALELSLQNLDDLRTQPEEVSHREELFNLRTLAQIYRGIGDQNREDAVYSRLQQISMSAEEKQDTELMLLGRDRERQFINGRFAEAAKLLLQMLAKQEKAITFTPLMRAKALETLAQTYYAAGNLDLALQSFHQAFDLLHQALDSTLPFLTDSQRNEFAMQIDSTSKIFYSMCYQYRLSHPEWLPEMYALILWQKNLVSRSLRQQQHLLAVSNDERLGQLQRQLKELRIKLAEITRQTPSAPLLLELRQKEFTLEKQLIERMNQLSSVRGEAPSLNSLLNAMRPTDAAIEMIRLELNDGRAPTSRVLYLALVIRPTNTPPITMVELGDAEDVENDQIAVNQMLKSRSFEPGAKASIPASKTWKALEPGLRGAKRIYLSPAGIFNQSAFLAWKVSEDKFLIDLDDLDLRPVSSTAVLLEHKSTTPASRALLIGNPNFNQFPSEISFPAATSSHDASLHCEDTDLQALSCLTNSGIEIEAIYSILKHAHWDVAPLLENSHASKTAVLAVHHPKILHIATHGFFTPLHTSGAEVDPTALEWQLENSGLFFAGANLTLKGQVNQSIDNGVLTAFESQNLDLDGTELVVLSACDTGRGQLSTADEVLGLRRSFQVAGANGILMSMWNVDDQATTDLMTKFYQEWIATGDPYTALRKAALTIKEHLSDPYYWAPFVLYGGK